MTIHPTAIIADGAIIDESATIGPGAVIGANVKIGKGTKVDAHAVIDGHTVIGEDCHIFPGAIVGLEPQDKSYKGEPTGVILGDRAVIREYATIHRSTGEGHTVIGDDAFIMNYAHVAHNCKLGNGVVMANGASMAGHCEIGDYVVMSGFIVLHQNLRVGRGCMFSAMTGSRLDLPPFTNLDGRPCKVRGINVLGLRRMKVSAEVRTAIKETYRLIYRSGLNLSNALARVEEEIHQHPEVKEIVQFFRDSKRGVAGAFAGAESGEGDEEKAAVKDQGVLSESGVGAL